jgi:hypothetical protein
MLCGELPFRGSRAMVLHQVLHDEPRPPRRQNDKIPRDLETICQKAMAKSPSRRYQTARELADDLRRFQSREPILARPVGNIERLAKWARRRPAAAALLVMSALALLALVGGGVAGVYSTWLLDANTQLQGTLDEAGRQRDRAEQAQGEAENARRGEEAQRAQTESLLYFRTIERAHSAWRENNVRRMVELLQSCQPEKRGWEWHYLYRLCHSDLLTLRGHVGAVTGVAFSTDGTRIATSSGDQTAKIWDARTGQEMITLKGHAGEVRGVAFSPDGTRLASASSDGTVKIWDVKTGQQWLTINVDREGGVWSVAFSPDGTRLACKTVDGTVWIRDAKTGHEALTLKTPNGSLGYMAFSPDGTRLANGTLTATVKIWDVKSAQEVVTLFTRHKGTVTSVVFSPDGERLASASTDRRVKFWEWKT